MCSLFLIGFRGYMKYIAAKVDHDRPAVVAALVLLLIGSLASLAAIVSRQRESVRASWFFCFVIATSQQLVSKQWYGVTFEEDQFLCILAVLRHCSFHPVPLLLVMGSMLGILLAHNDVRFFGPFEQIRRVWIICILPLMFCAYTQDFTVRVKAISTGMILPPGVGGDPDRETGAPHESPLSGRSARSICWLMMLITWVAWGASMIGKANKKAEAGSHYEYLFENRLPICTWLVPCLLSALILLWVSCKSKAKCKAPWLADVMLLICSCAAPALIFADYVPVFKAFGIFPDLVQLEYVLQSQRWVRSTVFVSEQVLVQAGCHPLFCLCPCALMLLHTAVCEIINYQQQLRAQQQRGIRTIITLELDAIEFSVIVSWIIWITSTIDYLNRYRAIRRALQRAQQNAASTQSLLDSIIMNPSSGLELQPIQHLNPMDPVAEPAEAPVSSDSVAVAVVRHAERADAGHALDDWGCSEDAAAFPHDPPITAEGVQQAKELARDLKQQLVSLDVIISSPYLRCLQTAEVLAEEFGVFVLLDAEVGHWDERTHVPTGWVVNN
eukprot:Skav211721  [mRNA]  locus=scaffold2852:770568:775501:- [translate_table: standard]